MEKPRLSANLARLTEGLDWRMTNGHSGASTFLLSGVTGNRYLKMQSPGVRESLRQEKARMEWLKGKLSVPEVIHYEQDDSGEYLLMSEIPGKDASDRSYDTMLPQLMRELAEGLRRIHDVPVAGCPFDERLDRKIREAERRAKDGLVDEQDFDEMRQGCTAEELFRQLIVLKPAVEDLVFTHGDYCLPNVILENGRISGFIDWGRAGVADRYQDLALAVRSIRHNFGDAHVRPFLEAYGIEQPDENKLFYYQLMDEFF